MATYFVASGGSNTSPYDTWAKAATSLATALAAATSNGDVVAIQYDGVPSTDNTLAADTTYTAAANIAIISSTNSGTSTITPTAMGTANWIGNSTANRSVTFAGAYTVFMYGLTLRTAGATSDNIIISNSDGASFYLDNCYLWSGNTATASRVTLGYASNAAQSYVNIKNSTLRFGSTSQTILLSCAGVMENCTISSDGSTVSTLFTLFSQDLGGGYFSASGCDFSHITGTLVGASTQLAYRMLFDNCKLGVGVVPLASQTVTNLSSFEIWLFNCSSGDEHYNIGHYNALGSTICETGIYANDGASYDGTNRLSWKIVTTADCSYYSPYVSPWIDRYHSDTSAITPYLECVRSGSSTAYNNDELWSEWSYQGTSGYPISTIVSDRMDLAGTPAAQTSSSKTGSDWTGENATSWFGKLSPTASITPQEIGHLRARVCVGVASSTVYVDPTIRGTS